MSVPDTTVVHGHDIQSLPPIRYKTAGTLVAALRAVLVDGWNETPVMSMTFDGATGLVTATFAEEHGYTYPQVIEVTGANETEYNGRWRIAEQPTSHALKFAISGVPSGDATGTLYMKCGAAGWTMPLISADGNIAYFKPQPLRGGNYTIRVANDLGATYPYSTYDMDQSLVSVVSDFTDEMTYTAINSEDSSRITHGIGATQYTGAAVQVGDALEWSFAANQHMLYLFITGYENNYEKALVTLGVSFGYLASRRTTPDFLWCTCQYYPGSLTYTNAAGSYWGYQQDNTSTLREVSHGPSGTSTPEGWSLEPECPYLGKHGSSAIDGGKLLYKYPLRAWVGDTSGNPNSRLLGILPGVGHLLHQPTVMPTRTVFDGEDGTFLFIKHTAAPLSSSTSYVSDTDNVGASIFDISGPWPTGA